MRQGFALLTAVFIMLVFSLLAIGITMSIILQSRLAVDSYRYSRAFYLAEAGRSFGMRVLGNYSDWTQSMGFPVTRSMAGGYFSVASSSPSRDSIILTVTGMVTLEGRTYSRTTKATIQRAGTWLFGDYAVASYGIASNYIRLNSYVKVNGSVFARGNLQLTTGTVVTGDAIATGTNTGGTVNGLRAAKAATPETQPVLDTTYYANQISIAAQQPKGNFTLSSSTTYSGIKYVNGDVTISNITVKISGSYTIVATGKVKVSTSSGKKTTIGDNLTIIAGGQIIITSYSNSSYTTIGKNNFWYSNYVSSGNSISTGYYLRAGGTGNGQGVSFISPGIIYVNYGNQINGFIFSSKQATIYSTSTNKTTLTGVLIASYINYLYSYATVNYNLGLVNYSAIPGLSGIYWLGGKMRVVNWQEVY